MSVRPDEIEELVQSRIDHESDLDFFRRWVEQKYQRWLTSVDVLVQAWAESKSAKEITALVTAERFAYGQLKTAIGCVRDEAGTSTVPISPKLEH